MTTYISQADTNKRIRAALKAAFPGVKFSVSGTNGSATNVTWTGGPTEYAVDKVIHYYKGSRFDGMTDSMSYVHQVEDGERVHFGADFIFTRRDPSADELARAAREIAEDGHADANPTVWGSYKTRYGFHDGFSDSLTRHYIRGIAEATMAGATS